MIKLSEEVLIELKKPLGKVFPTIQQLIATSKRKKIISIGDISTINMINTGTKPHLAVFDFKSHRKELESQLKNILEINYPNPKKYENESGTISNDLINDAPKLIEEGGGILIKGEEDICALAFIMSADDRYVIIYGQPKEGIVLIKPTNELKNKIKKWILSSRTLSHKV